MNNLYLGFGNPRKAHILPNRRVAVLCNGDDHRVLDGAIAESFIRNAQALTDYLCGVAYNADMHELVESVEYHKHDHHAYNAIFDTYWGN